MKKNNWLLKLYVGILLFVFALIIFHAPLSVYGGTLFPQFELLIKSWKEILLIAALPIGIYLAMKKGLAKQMKTDYLFLAIVLYAALHLFLLDLFATSVKQVLAGLAIDLRYILFFTLFYIAIKLMPEYRRKVLFVGILSSVVSVIFSFLQIFILPADILAHIGYGKNTIEPYLTIDKNPDFIRINGTLRGPNPLGSFMLTIVSIIAAWLVTQKQKSKDRKIIIFLALFGFSSIIVLWASYSRSALVATLLSFVIILVFTFAQKIKPQIWLGILALSIVFTGVLYTQKNSDFVQHVILHNNPTGGSARDSNEEHASSLQIGIERMLNQPFGAGIGSTGSASLFGNEPIIIENQYLFVAHESGWIGMLLFLFIFLSILWRLFKQKADWLALGLFASGVSLAAVGFLLPVWADDTVSIIWWGLAGVAMASGGAHAKRKQAK
ncbi:O-antigen ligase family protein [Candidatus Saccharibacteria bacterium]|nr:O-antigen ligase family protein [Candidatus Saccharibacteria bacterium]